MNVNTTYNMDCLEGIKQVDSESVDLIVTDPPYEVDYNKKSEQLSLLDKASDKQIKRDESFKDSDVDYNGLAFEMFRVLKKDTHCYIFCGMRQISKWESAMVLAGFKDPQVLVWKKSAPTFDMTFGHRFPINHEFILFFQKGWRKLNGYGVERHRFRSVLEFDAGGGHEFHSSEKPLDLLMFLVLLSSSEGDVCLDLFMGSGNHIISFIRLRRGYIGFEISPVYYRVVVGRVAVEHSQTGLFDYFNV